MACHAEFYKMGHVTSTETTLVTFEKQNYDKKRKKCHPPLYSLKCINLLANFNKMLKKIK